MIEQAREEIPQRPDQGMGTAELAERGEPARSGGAPKTDEGTAALITSAPSGKEQESPLFSAHEADELRRQWDSIQAGFVDEPRSAVEQADNLVAGTMKRLAEMFAEERSRLESQWDQGDNASTEDLRQALRHYRSFFSRLLSI